MDKEPIAVVGLGCRFPGGAEGGQKYWEMLAQGKNAWSPVPADRFNSEAFYHPDPSAPGCHNHRGGHFIQADVTAFDNRFFNISPIEATCMDPQQRVLLEIAFEALEDAGIPHSDLAGSKTGVYLACFSCDFKDMVTKDPMSQLQYTSIGQGPSILSNRISHAFDFRGPSMTIDTACSGSLVAIHQACQSLRSGESDTVLAGGANLILNPDLFVTMSLLHFLNDDGKCYTFDSRGAGYGRGEGVSLIVLKRLSDALRDGDNVRAVIRGTGVGQDGRTPGITLPSGEAQETLMRSVYQKSGLDPHDTAYIEAHGTGTVAGDNTEVRSISNVFHGPSKRPVFVGSAKANIGHLESSSGVAGLIKVILSMENRAIPPSPNFVKLKEGLLPYADVIKIAKKLEPWPVDALRRASIVSFGYGGTNAHLIVEAADQDSDIKEANVHQTSHSTQPHLFVVSAKAEDSLLNSCNNLADWLEKTEDSNNLVSDLAHTLSVRRTAMQYRHTFVANSRADVISRLREKMKPSKVSPSTNVVFVFTGQGAQWFGMGRELFISWPTFRNSILKSDQVLKDLGATWSLVQELSCDESSTRVDNSEISQPATTAIQIALVDTLRSIDIEPAAVVGHSSGEIGAAYAAGSIDQETALQIAYFRGISAGQCRSKLNMRGTMAAVGLSADEVRPYLAKLKTGRAVVACMNAPTSTTVSGDEAAILELIDALKDNSVFARKLKVETAYHSHHMQAIAEDYENSIHGVKHKPTNNVLFFSSVEEKQKRDGFSAQYWVENLVSPVRFTGAIQACCKRLAADQLEQGTSSAVVLLEIGPHGALEGPVKQSVAATSKTTRLETRYISALTRKQDAIRTLLQAAGTLFETGYSVDLRAANSSNSDVLSPKVLHDLPSYAWDHSQSYLMDSRHGREHRLRRFAPHDLLGIRVPGLNPEEPMWRHFIGASTLPWVRDHVVDNNAVFPAAGFLAMAIEGKAQIIKERENNGLVPAKFSLRDVVFTRPLNIPTSDSGSVEVYMSLKSSTNNRRMSPWDCFRVCSVSEDGVWYEHCKGYVMAHLAPSAELEGASLLSSDPADITPEEGAESVTSEGIYSRLRALGNDYGPSFAVIQDMQVGQSAGSGRIVLPDIAKYMPKGYFQPHVIHPSTLDALIHSCLPIFAQSSDSGSVFTAAIGEMEIDASISSAPGQEISFTTQVQLSSPNDAKINISASQTDGLGNLKPVIKMFGGELKAVGQINTSIGDDFRKAGLAYQFSWGPDPDMRIPSTRPRKSIPTREKKLVESKLIAEVKIEEVMTSESASVQCLEELSNFVKQVLFKTPDLSVLQIGGSCQDSTVPILRALDESKYLRLKSYDYADFDSDLLDEAGELLTDYESFVDCKWLDIEQEPINQGFTEEQYDIVIFPQSLSAIDIDSGALENAASLLKPTGWFLVVNSTTKTNANSGANYDLSSTSGLSLTQWDEKLRQNGMTGVDFSKSYLVDEDQQMSFFVSRRHISFEVPVSEPNLQVFFASDHLPKTAPVSQHQIENVKAKQPASSLFNLDLNSIHEDDIVVLIEDDLDKTILTDGSDEAIERVMETVATAHNILWVGLTSSNHPAKAKAFGAVTGLARSARRENSALKIVTFSYDADSADGSMTLPELMQEIIYKSFSAPPDLRSAEREYWYSNNELLIPRLIPRKSIDNFIDDFNGRAGSQIALLHDKSRCLRLEVQTPGLLDSMRFVNDKKMHEPVPADKVEIQAFAYGVNLKDVLIALGHLRAPARMIGECAGVVTQVGSNFKDKYKVGDRVAGWSGDTFGSRIRFDGFNSFRIPDSLSFSEAASIPVAFWTAYLGIVEIANLQKGQSILIHAAAGGLGHAAIQIAQHIGAEIYVTVGSEEKRQYLVDNYGIPREKMFNSRNTDFKKGILQATGGNGVDCLLNSLSGEMLQESWACIGRFGTFLEVGKTDMLAKNSINLEPFEKHVTFASIDLAAISDLRSWTNPARAKAILNLFENGFCRPMKRTEMPLSDIEAAFRLLQSGKLIGKIVLTSDEKTQVNSVRDLPIPLQLPENSTYVVAGGTAGLGLEIGRHLAKRGASNLVLLSRRELSEANVRSLTKEFSVLGAQVTIASCDVTDRKGVSRLASQVSNELPPVRGVIQCAMVLRDQLISDMDADSFKTVLAPKVDGTVNLYEAFGSHLDFFVNFSSTAAIIGNIGSANYTAACAFQDAFVQNQPAISDTRFVSINLGAMEETGFLARNEHLGKMMFSQGMVPLKNQEMFALLEYVLSGNAKKAQERQFVIGFNKYSLAATGSDVVEEIIQNPLLRLLPLASGRASGLDDANSGVDISSAKDIYEVQAIIARDTADKIAVLMASDVENIDLETPLLEFGIDSLIGIELKNWVARKFSVNVTTSEIFDAKSINALALSIGKKSPLAAQVNQAGEESQRSTDVAPAPIEQEAGLENGESHELPKQPVPQLSETFDEVVHLMKPSLSPDELNALKQQIEEFKLAEGLELQNRLLAKAADPNIVNWYSDISLRNMYLKDRSPLGNFFGCGLTKAFEGDSAARAAYLTMSVLNYRQAMTTGQLPSRSLGGRELDDSSANWLFNGCREPGEVEDTMRRYPENEHIVVCRNGQAFKVPLQTNSQDINQDILREVFQSIKDSVEDPNLWVGSLTAGRRDNWAKLRKHLITVDENNKGSLAAIESAAFIVCLDDAAPETSSERAFHFCTANASNRWFDKTLQLAVADNGASSLIVEHSEIDGISVSQLRQYFDDQESTNILHQHTATPVVGDVTSIIERLPLKLDHSLKEKIQILESDLIRYQEAASFTEFNIEGLGEDMFRQKNLYGKSVVQLLIHQACYRLLGGHRNAIQIASLASYRKGRVGTSYTWNPAVVDFCNAADNMTASDNDLADLLRKSVREISKGLVRAGKGLSAAQHLFSLNWAVESGENMPSLFSNPAIKTLMKYDIVVDTVNNGCKECGNITAAPESLNIHFDVQENRVHFGVWLRDIDAGKLETLFAETAGQFEKLLNLM